MIQVYSGNRNEVAANTDHYIQETLSYSVSKNFNPKPFLHIRLWGKTSIYDDLELCYDFSKFSTCITNIINSNFYDKNFRNKEVNGIISKYKIDS